MGGFRSQPQSLVVAGRHSPAFHVEVDAALRVLALSGEMDLAAVAPFAVAAAELTVGRHGQVTVDLDGLRFIDAAGLGALVTLANTVRRDGYRLTARRAHPPVSRVLRIGGVLDALSVPAANRTPYG